ncbi:MAG: tetratricopeptide repeat protein [Candidatus Dormiibacterota bacterium]
MAHTDPRGRLLAAAADPAADIAEAALWIAVEDLPAVDPGRWLRVLDDLAGHLDTHTADRPSTALAALLRDRLNLRGAGGGDPRTHYLSSVMERGAGTPLAWGAIWMAVGRRAGIQVEGIALPGHFAVRVAGLVVDSFSGEPLDHAELRQIAGRHFGHPPERVEPRWLEPASPRRILARMSRNLRGCYASLEDWTLSLRAADRCVDLLPEEPGERRDRGLLLWRMGQPQRALSDLNHYLTAAPADAPDRAHVQEVVGRLRSFLN